MRKDEAGHMPGFFVSRKWRPHDDAANSLRCRAAARRQATSFIREAARRRAPALHSTESFPLERCGAHRRGVLAGSGGSGLPPLAGHKKRAPRMGRPLRSSDFAGLSRSRAWPNRERVGWSGRSPPPAAYADGRPASFPGVSGSNRGAHAQTRCRIRAARTRATCASGSLPVPRGTLGKGSTA